MMTQHHMHKSVDTQFKHSWLIYKHCVLMFLSVQMTIRIPAMFVYMSATGPGDEMT